MKRATLILLILAGCGEPLTTAEGCPVLISEYGQAIMQGCIQAYYEEQARANGGTVTKCFGAPGSVTCVSQ